MTERSKIIDAFVAQSDWAAWQRLPLAGDASGRQYSRLQHGGETVVLMDAPPEHGEDTKKFAQVAAILADQGLSPPQILAHDRDQGIMVLSDLGDNDFAKWLATRPSDARLLYQAATDILIHLNGFVPDAALVAMTPQIGGGMVDVAAEFYAMTKATELCAQMTLTLAEFAPEPSTLALRDYHAENLIWRPDEKGIAGVGLLDFQDAFIAPAGYDLASLLGDVRRDVDPTLAAEMRDYFMSKTGAGPSFPAQLACLGAQRNMRILGVFARLAKTKGKPKYLDLLPRVWANMIRDLDHPALTDLRTAAQDILPPPNAATLARLRA